MDSAQNTTAPWLDFEPQNDCTVLQYKSTGTYSSRTVHAQCLHKELLSDGRSPGGSVQLPELHVLVQSCTKSFAKPTVTGVSTKCSCLS